MIGFQRLPVTPVDPEKGEVQGVAGIGEVVGVPSEEAQLKLCRRHHPDIGKPPVGVGRVPSAIVQSRDLHPDRALTRRMLGADTVLDQGDDLSAGLLSAGLGASLVQSPQHLIGDVLRGDELVHVVVGDWPLLFEGGRIEAIVEKGLSVPGHLTHRTSSAVMIGHDQPVGRDESGRTTWNPKGGQPCAVEPGLVGLKTIGFGEVIHGGVLEGPHLPHVEATRPGRILTQSSGLSGGRRAGGHREE